MGARRIAQVYECEDGAAKRTLRPGFLAPRPEKSVLHQVARANLETFLAELRAEDPDGHGLPKFVEREFRRFLDCDVAARGFLRFVCGSCGQEMALGFSCRTMGFCPSCLGRRMSDDAAHLIDRVLPFAPHRMPFRLWPLLDKNVALLGKARAIFMKTVRILSTAAGQAPGPAQGSDGAVCFTQHFGSMLDANPHFHALAPSGGPHSAIDLHRTRIPSGNPGLAMRPECNDLQNMETPFDFAVIDAFPARSQGLGWAVGEPIPAVSQPARVVADLALAHEIQAALDGGGNGGEGLTYREAAPLYGVSRTTIGRHVSLARLAPDIQKVVARLTTMTASEPIDRKKLKWVAEPVKWPEQRARFQKVVDDAFGAVPAPIAKTLAHAITMRHDIRAKRITLKRVAVARETTVEELREYLVLVKLAPVVRDQVLGMTTMTMNELVTEEKLRFIARERNHVEQRRMYEKLLAGQLRCTRADMRRPPSTADAGPEPVQLGQLSIPQEQAQIPGPAEDPSIASAVG